MAKSFIDIVQDSPKTGLDIPVKTKKPLSRTNTPPTEPSFVFTLAALVRGGIQRFLPERRGQPSPSETQDPMKFLLALVVASLRTSIELHRLHHQAVISERGS